MKLHVNHLLDLDALCDLLHACMWVGLPQGILLQKGQHYSSALSSAHEVPCRDRDSRRQPRRLHHGRVPLPVPVAALAALHMVRCKPCCLGLKLKLVKHLIRWSSSHPACLSAMPHFIHSKREFQ